MTSVHHINNASISVLSKPAVLEHYSQTPVSAVHIIRKKVKLNLTVREITGSFLAESTTTRRMATDNASPNSDSFSSFACNQYIRTFTFIHSSSKLRTETRDS